MSEAARLLLPARPEFVSVARLTVAALAGRLGFDVDAVEDIKVAVAEALTLLLGNDIDPAEPGRLEVRAKWSDTRLEVTARRDGGLVVVDHEDAAIAVMVMEAMMDGARIDRSADGLTVVRLHKARR